jgi:BirA family biotin operon repressor/biotin-[acetyl-CoA-carboxylase] ligase
MKDNREHERLASCPLAESALAACSPPSDEWHLPTRHVGRRVLVYEQTDSTNARALQLADELANDGLIVLAREQTAGRGQHGRSWLCPTGSSVLMSVLLFPEGACRRPPLLVAWAAVSVCKLIERVAGLQARIKWPNDVLVDGRKVCGILIEQQSRAGVLATIAGIGLNVMQSQRDFADTDLREATSLHAAAGRSYDVGDIARSLITVLDKEYHALCEGALKPLETRWKHHLELLGKTVVAETSTGDLVGKLLGLSFDAIELQTHTGERRVLQPETVRHLTVRQP